MRLAQFLAAAVLVGILHPATAGAQSLSDRNGPAELPPANFSGRTYVDSTGCLFVRAGRDGLVNWVPQVTRNAQLVCGFRPTLTKAAPTAPVAVAVPTPKAKVQAPARAVAVAAPAASRLNTTVPKGYVSVWTDGRLNPNRGPQTAQGDAQMAALWTDKVPMTMRAQTAPVKAPVAVTRNVAPKAVAPANTFVLSTKSPNIQATGDRFVQVGAYGDAANAHRAAATISALGLPVAQRAMNMQGKRVTLVMAGPISGNVAARVQTLLRQAGYHDAFVR